MHAQDKFDLDPNRGPIRRLVALLIDEALELGATEILLDRFHDRVNMQYRIDGVLQQRDCPPLGLWRLILARLHTLAAQQDPQSLCDQIIISSVPAELERPPTSRDKYPVTLCLEVQQDSVRLIIKQSQ